MLCEETAGQCWYNSPYGFCCTIPEPVDEIIWSLHTTHLHSTSSLFIVQEDVLPHCRLMCVLTALFASTTRNAFSKFLLSSGASDWLLDLWAYRCNVPRSMFDIPSKCCFASIYSGYANLVLLWKAIFIYVYTCDSLIWVVLSVYFVRGPCLGIWRCVNESEGFLLV